MAWYYNQDVRVCGRIVTVTFRYGSYMGSRVTSGKPLKLTKSVRERIFRALNRPHKERQRERIEESIADNLT